MPEVISVAELNTRVSELFSKSASLNDIWVSGEISGLKKYPSGYYFVLKDASSAISAVMFKSALSRLNFEPAENMKVRAFGRVALYVPRGQYQFIVEVVEKSGVGDRYLAFEALKKKLGEEGLFEQSHKRTLPVYPKKIGVVTSQSGAVIHDIIMTSASRYNADIILAPAMVQGEGAAESIVAGIELLNRTDVDVIIVGRGGGSIEDLWAFNEEIVARAIYNSRIPVVSAVGHETDFTISDFVADARAPTPTGAAAIILRDKSEIRSELQTYTTRLNRAMKSVIDRMRHSFELVDSKLGLGNAMDDLELRSMMVEELSKTAESAVMAVYKDMRNQYTAVDARLRPSRALEDMQGLRSTVEASLERIQASSRHIIEMGSAGLEAVSEGPEKAINAVLKISAQELDSNSKQLEGLNPSNVLTRGYSMITDKGGKVLTSINRINVGDSIIVHLRDGSAEADITAKELKK
jgi:exodeoxyribonuclease VII large subunit